MVTWLREQHEWTSAVHVLVLGPIEPDAADRWWHVEHPDACPQACYWYPASDGDGLLGAQDEFRGEPEYRCLVRWEIEAIGLDCLTDRHGREWMTRLAYTSPTFVVTHPEKLGLDRLLPEGRYLVECWAHDGYGQGEYGGQGDGDSSFTLLGPETPAGLTYPPEMLRPSRYFTTRPKGARPWHR